MGKYSAEKLLVEILALGPVEFVGICKIIGVEIYNTEVEIEKNVEDGVDCGKATANIEPREFYEIWCDVCDTIDGMNRTRRRNLGKLVYAATKKEKEE